MKHFIRIVISGITLSLALPVGAQSRATLRLQPLIDESQLIVIGTLVPPVATAQQGASVIPLRLLKGELSENSKTTIQLSAGDLDCPTGYPEQPIMAIWFLSLGRDSLYFPVSDSLGVSCFLGSTLFELDGAAVQALPDMNRHQPPIDNVALAIAAQASQTNGDSPEILIDDALFVADASRSVQESIYRDWHQAGNARLRMLALIGEVALGDGDAILSLATGSQDYRRIDLPNRGLRGGKYHDVHQVVHGFSTYEGAIAAALARVKTPDASGTRALGVVARRSDLSLEIRRSAAKALRTNGTQQAAAELAALLNVDDLEICSQAVAGISDFAMSRESAKQPGKTSVQDVGADQGDQGLAEHAVPGPAAVNAENRSQLVQFWSEWSKTHLIGGPNLHP